MLTHKILQNKVLSSCCLSSFSLGFILKLFQASTENVEVHLKDIAFSNGAVTNTTFQNVQKHITRLELSHSTVNVFQDCAMASKPFDTLQYLTVVDSKIEHLHKDLFCHNKWLTTFEFRADKKTLLLQANNDALTNLKVLETLQIQNYISDPDVIMNLTGSASVAPIYSLTTVDFRFNYITDLKANSFSNAPSLIQIFLEDNAIASIHKDAFSQLNSLVRLSLLKNQLKYLENNIFQPMQYSLLDVNLHQNQLVCDCRLAWFKSYYNESDFFNKGNPLYCANSGQTIMDTIFCDEDETPRSSTSTRSTSTSTPGTNHRKTREIKCQDVSHERRRDWARDHPKSFAATSTKVYDDDVHFNFYSTDQDEFFLEIDGKDQFKNKNLCY